MWYNLAMLKITYNSVRLTAKRKMALQAVAYFAKTLKINRPEISIQVNFKYLMLDTFRVMAECTMPKKNCILLEIDANLSQDWIIQIVAHEMVHAKQWIKGELVTKKGYMYWKGEKVRNDLAYHKHPWEVEAMRKQIVMMYEFFDKGC